MATTPESDLPLNLNLADGNSPRGRRWFHKRYLLVLLIPVFMFLGGVMGMYFQPVPIQKFYALTGLQPGGGSDSPIALPPNVELPAQMAETMLPSDVVGLARVMPRGDVSVVAAPYGAGDARLSELLVSVGDRVERGAPVARLDNQAALEGAVLLAEANLAVRQATLLQTRSAVESSRDEAQATLDQARANLREARANLERTERRNTRYGARRRPGRCAERNAGRGNACSVLLGRSGRAARRACRQPQRRRSRGRSCPREARYAARARGRTDSRDNPRYQSDAGTASPG